MKSDIDNPFSIADHTVVMRQRGYIVGYCGRTTLEKLAYEINNKCEDYFPNAKGLYVMFYINEKSELPAVLKGEKGARIMREIEGLCNENANVVFDMYYDNTLVLEMIEYALYLSGIENLKK